MNKDIIKYRMRSIIGYLEGDIDKFNLYKNKAIEIYNNEYGVIIGDLILKEIKMKLYEMVS